MGCLLDCEGILGHVGSLLKVKPGRVPYCRLWLAFFLFTLALGLFVQLVFLPRVFPQWHAGDGLLTGGDWITYHEMALSLSNRIRSEGWQAWSLRPDGQAPAGIAAAIYTVVAPKPWTLLPVNAALHATAAIALLAIVRLFLPSWRRATWCVLPFFLFPSSALWTTQILKDSYSIPGFLLFLCGWLTLERTSGQRGAGRALAASLGTLVVGVALVWIVRPYMLKLMAGVAVLPALLQTGAWVARRKTSVRHRLRGTLVVLLLWGVVFCLFICPALGAKDLLERSPRSTVPAPQDQGITSETDPLSSPTILWKDTPWLPDFLESFFYTLATIRLRSTTLYPHAASNIDVDVEFQDVYDVFAYLPRALHIAFFSPFPNHWTGQGTSAVTTLMRRISAGEMLVVYAALCFLPIALWRWCRNVGAWTLFLMCAGLMVAFALSVANIGAVYRVRYPFSMTLVAVAIAGAVDLSGRLRRGGAS